MFRIIVNIETFEVTKVVEELMCVEYKFSDFRLIMLTMQFEVHPRLVRRDLWKLLQGCLDKR